MSGKLSNILVNIGSVKHLLLNPYQLPEPIVNDDLHAETGTLEGSALLLIAIARFHLLFVFPSNKHRTPCI
jgi:hypothetical protein